jgi:hypothetical protein
VAASAVAWSLSTSGQVFATLTTITVLPSVSEFSQPFRKPLTSFIPGGAGNASRWFGGEPGRVRSARSSQLLDCGSGESECFVHGGVRVQAQAHRVVIVAIRVI